MSAELLKVLTSTREKAKANLADAIARVEACRRDLADIETHIATQRERDRQARLTNAPTEAWPPVPPRDPQQNGAAVLGQAAPTVDRERSQYCDRTTALWSLTALYADAEGSGWKWGGEVCPSELGDGEVPLMVRISGPGPTGELARFDTLHDRHGLRTAGDAAPRPASVDQTQANPLPDRPEKTEVSE